MRESIQKGDSVYIVLEDYYQREDTEITSRDVAAVFTSRVDADAHRHELELLRGSASRFKVKGYTLDYHVGKKR